MKALVLATAMATVLAGQAWAAAGTCANADSCPSGEGCRDGLCLPVGAPGGVACQDENGEGDSTLCAGDEACVPAGGGYACAPLTCGDQCATACADNEGCEGGQVCVDGQCEPAMAADGGADGDDSPGPARMTPGDGGGCAVAGKPDTSWLALVLVLAGLAALWRRR